MILPAPAMVLLAAYSLTKVEGREAMPPIIEATPEIEADFMRTCLEPNAISNFDTAAEHCRERLAVDNVVLDLRAFQRCLAAGLERSGR